MRIVRKYWMEVLMKVPGDLDSSQPLDPDAINLLMSAQFPDADQEFLKNFVGTQIFLTTVEMQLSGKSFFQ